MPSSPPGEESTCVPLLFAAAERGDTGGAAASAAETGHREAEVLLPGTPLRQSSPSPVSAPCTHCYQNWGHTGESFLPFLLSPLLPDQGDGEGAPVLFGCHCSRRGEAEDSTEEQTDSEQQLPC